MENFRDLNDTIFTCVALSFLFYFVTSIGESSIVGFGIEQSIYTSWRNFLNGEIDNFSIAAASIGGVVGWFLTAPPSSDPVKKEGRHITKNLKEIARDLKSEGKAEGIQICPGLPISLAREKQHFALIAESGQGKSQIITPIIKQVIGRGDRVIIYDFKGDETDKYPSDQSYLFAPWLAGTTEWDIASDIVNAQDAKTFAATLIPENDKNPFFVNSARDILTGFILYLQSTKGADWSIGDIGKVMILPTPEQYQILQNYYPQAAQYLAKADSETTSNVKSSLSAAMGGMLDLSEAWDGSGEKISIREFILNVKKYPKKIIILQGNSRYAEQSKIYINSIISVIASTLGDYQLENKDNRIWLFLDELQELGRINGLEKFVAVGRSKGVRLVLASQDPGRLIDIYGRDLWNSIYANCANKIIGKLTGDSADYYSKIAGKAEYSRNSTTTTKSLTNQGGGSAAFSKQIDRRQAVPAHRFGSDCGKFPIPSWGVLGSTMEKYEIRAFFLTGFEHIGLLSWPITAWQSSERPKIPADWTKPGYVSRLRGNPNDTQANQSASTGNGGLNLTAQKNDKVQVDLVREPETDPDEIIQVSNHRAREEQKTDEENSTENESDNKPPQNPDDKLNESVSEAAADTLLDGADLGIDTHGIGFIIDTIENQKPAGGNIGIDVFGPNAPINPADGIDGEEEPRGPIF
jgi:hypothetical protein